MADNIVVCWLCVVMFIVLECFCASDTSLSVSSVDFKNISVSSSLNATNKLQPAKDVPNLSSNASEHTQNDTVGATFYGSVPRKMDSGALLRGFYVLVGIGALIIIYVVVKMMRLRRIRSTTVRKYGVLASQEDLEMAPLDADDEEEDTTLFDVSQRNQL